MLRTFAIAFALSVSAYGSTVQLVTNGNFEAGGTGWSSIETVATPNKSCATLWTIASSGSATDCYSVAAPLGTRAAYTSFDGYGVGGGYTQVQNYTLSQTLIIPENITGATLSFQDVYQFGYSGLLRTLHFDLKSTQGALLANLFTQQFGTADFSSTWKSNSADVMTALQALGGQTVRLEIVATIPQYFTGAAGFGLDNVSLLATVSDAPEPGSYSLLLGALGLLTASLRRQAVRRQ